MQCLPRTANPFAMMIDPQAVLAKIGQSERLERLHRRICRPLDKPLLALDPTAETSGQDLSDFDSAIDAGDAAPEAFSDRLDS